ncbi:hypothetical protein [Pseudalkalibacillus salsuginis]|uniref:hypothetical protein n=1 Tax=Pseudalkalibacillus salsuginis TaxID=2910972 RepID=UPI001F18BF78|nr:hypothetical protein [Pseudalkalibacillus salsuginis]MCF6408283.1 hypothetical protein [Pseudalkalibacillus salsuginis]
MIITSIAGKELEKSKSNSPEEFFNRSEVTFLDGKIEKTLTVLYVRYFDEKISEFSSFETEELFEVEGRVIHLREVVALLALRAYPEFAKRHRVYINDEGQFASLFKVKETETVKKMVQNIMVEGRLELNGQKG